MGGGYEKAKLENGSDIDASRRRCPALLQKIRLYRLRSAFAWRHAIGSANGNVYEKGTLGTV